MDRSPHSRRTRVAGRLRAPRLPAALLLALLFLLASACGVIPGGSLGTSPPPPDALVVSFIDVGQGDGILVQAGGENYLIDAGKPEEGPNVVDFLRSRDVKALNGIVVSNPDADHIGGFTDVFDAYQVSTVYLSGDTKRTSTFNAFLRGVQNEGAQVVEARTGMQMDWGGARADVIAPPPGEFLSEEPNDNSVAILLTFGKARILLAGDAEKKEEEYMSNGPYTGPLTVLKVNHHGSNTSTTPLFLNRFPPEIAVIQVGADNSYGHPTPQTLRRLKAVGAQVFRNDEHGDVIVTIRDEKAEVAVTNR